MAKTGEPATKNIESADGEPQVDYMADAPSERPYGVAVSDQQRELLRAAGVPLA